MSGAASTDSTLLADSSITLRDGRNLAYREWGVVDGRPVLFFHGTPDSRHYCPDKFPRVTRRTIDLNVDLVTVDRPGCSRSTPKPGRTLMDWPDDVAELASRLGWSSFSIAAHSGGGPYAMACAVAMPGRVERIGLISSAAPPDELTGWADDYLSEKERYLYGLARADLEAALPAVEEHCRWLVETPESFADPEEWPESDRWALLDPPTRQIMLEEVLAAGESGIQGYVWDKLNMDLLPWGFSPREVRVETHVWQGEDDLIPRGAFDYLCATIPGARGTLWPGGHVAMLRGEHWGEVLEAIAS